MVKDFEKYHGIALTRFAHSFGEIKINSNINQDNSSYIINDFLGLYIKFSKKRLTPWQFTFNYEHNKCINDLSQICDKGYVVFICNNDGICCITFDEYFKLISNVESELAKSISISRFKNEKYQVSGTDGVLKGKISDSYIEL
jgi:hypothetical protein